MNPNHYLSAAIWYLFQNRPRLEQERAIGKTLVSTSMIDRVGAALGRRVCEVPVGFKWFVDGLVDGSFGFGGEESAGASFLRRDGTVWTTDKDGIIMDLLASEIPAPPARIPASCIARYASATAIQSTSASMRPPRPPRRPFSCGSPPSRYALRTGRGYHEATLTTAPGNGARPRRAQGGAPRGWFAARPSGTEDVYKLYAESFAGRDHLAQVQAEAKEVVSRRSAAERRSARPQASTRPTRPARPASPATRGRLPCSACTAASRLVTPSLR